MPTIYIDDKAYDVEDGQNLLHAVLSLGFDLPYFCWHPALGSVGACRQCAVTQYKDENDTQGKLVMACMTPASDGTRISLLDQESKQFRANVIEWLMTNHPHDCPVCDEGGECHLQDMTVMSGHNYRRFRFNKRTFNNQYLGPFINHEMNRCITCYRCVRFYRDYAGGNDLDSFASRNRVYFGRHEDGVLESEFSGNLVEICPTGVFTDKTLKRHYTRKWDLQTAPSVCQHCGLGCNTIPGERYGVLRRILNRYNSEVNGYFLCDRGRFGYEFVNSEERIRQPILKSDSGNEISAVSKSDVLEHVQSVLSSNTKVIGIGSPRASLESNFALKKFVGPDKYYNGMSTRESELVSKISGILQNGPARSATLNDAKQADAVFVLGEDLTNTAPMLALALRQAAINEPKKEAQQRGIPEWNDAGIRESIQDEKGPIYQAVVASTKLDEVARETYYASPNEIAQLGFAVAHELNADAPAVKNLSGKMQSLARQIADDLKSAEHPLIVSGTSMQNDAIVEAAANLAWALSADSPANIIYTVPENNSLGLSFLEGKPINEAFEQVNKGNAEVAVILENDLYRRAPKSEVDSFLSSCKHVIAIDHLVNETTDKAEVALSASTFAEGSGTIVNNEGRAQRYFDVYAPDEEAIQESWRWIRDMAVAVQKDEFRHWQSLDQISAAMFEEITKLQRIKEVAPASDFRIEGQKIPRATHRYSGRTAMLANVTVHEPKPPQDPDSPLSHSMEGFPGQPPSSLINHYWAPGWNSVQSTNKFQNEVGGELRGGDPGIRLIEPNGNGEYEFFPGTFETADSNNGKLLVVPIHHIFGSEELSVESPGLAERVSEPYVIMSESSAKKLNVEDGQEATFTLSGEEYSLPVVFDEHIPNDVVGFPTGLPGTHWAALPSSVSFQAGGRQ